MVNEMDATQDWGQTSMRGVYRTVYLDKQFLSSDPDSPSSKQNKTKLVYPTLSVAYVKRSLHQE